jgi:hypothetical protein
MKKALLNRTTGIKLYDLKGVSIKSDYSRQTGICIIKTDKQLQKVIINQ